MSIFIPRPVQRVATTLLTLILFCVMVNAPAHARFGIRDAEIEETLSLYADNIFRVAGIPPGTARVFVLNNSDLNAFVSGGANIFINTGLIGSTKTPNELIGVIAHETGHIAGGHLNRIKNAQADARIPLIFSVILAAAAAAAGAGDGAAAILAGGAQIAQRNVLSFSRNQESAADQAASSYLTATHQSLNGLFEVMETLANQNIISRKIRNSYVFTHPLPRERRAALRDRAYRSPYTGVRDTAELQLRHDRMKAKLFGFLENPALVLRRFPPENKSIPARYARAVAYHHMTEDEKALAEINSLIAEIPDDPYFYEVKGQILFERGDITEALISYRKARDLAPSQPLIRIALGQALVASGQKKFIQEGVKELSLGMKVEREYASGWYSLAIGYDRLENPGQAQLATAERFLLIGRKADALVQAKRARDKLETGTPGWLRANDIASLPSPKKTN